MIPLTRINKLRHAGSKRVQEYLARNAERLVLIYSKQWNAYWRPERCGYTHDPEEAGVYGFAVAFDATYHCGPEKEIFYQFLTPQDFE